MTEDTLQLLRDAFMDGMSDKEACLIAGIVPSTLYNYCKATPGFLEQKQLLKKTPTIKAKRAIVAALDEGDENISKWYLERRDKRFRPKQSHDIEATVITEPPSDITEGLLAAATTTDKQ